MSSSSSNSIVYVEVARLGKGVVPLARIKGSAPDPSDCDRLGELVLGQIVEHRVDLLLDLVVELVLECRKGPGIFIVIIVDVVGRSIGIGGRNLRLQLLRALDQPT